MPFFIQTSYLLHTKCGLLFEHKENPETLGIQTSLIYLIVTNSSEPVG